MYFGQNRSEIETSDVTSDGTHVLLGMFVAVVSSLIFWAVIGEIAFYLLSD